MGSASAATTRWPTRSNACGKVSPTTYKFLAPTVGVPAVAYASAAFGNYVHPDNLSAAKARYLVIYAVGVSAQLHGMREPRSGQTYATCVFLELEALARQKDGCVGLALRVRSDNGRAIGFYQKIGFAADPRGPVPAPDGGASYLTMRRLF